jgi:hypothetical protein
MDKNSVGFSEFFKLWVDGVGLSATSVFVSVAAEDSLESACKSFWALLRWMSKKITITTRKTQSLMSTA